MISTFRLVGQLPYTHQRLVQTIIQHSIIEGKAAKHWGGQLNCVCCGQEDTIKHRIHDCPATQEYREAAHDALTHFAIHPITTDRCLLVHHSKYWEWLIYLGSIPEPSVTHITVEHNELVELFTDGSACPPNHPMVRLASGAVFHPLTSTCVSQFLVPGILQSIDRAELWAAICA